ncbi:MAG: methionine adenosyltransferase domain-containing protein [Alphaproteobacteria bacterium]|nr:methionine adenosyltransferase domain-containing protein [Alphaproteobacteria bacterium]
MLKTAEAVSLGHPDKTADYISSYILDRAIEQDSSVKYAVEVMIKDNTVIFGGEIKGNVNLSNLHNLTLKALAEIGYSEDYAKIWGEYALQPSKIKTINLIGLQSSEINQGVEQNGWGDQGVFVGYACQGVGLINRELYLARRLNSALYQKALKTKNLGLDIKTQITIDERGNIKTAVVAIPMLVQENLEAFIIEVLGQNPKSLIVNGTGQYTYHSSIADCGITGRKLACDFYSTACPVGGGSPWTKDASKADLTLNLYARKLALENLKDNDECFVYLSSCIGRAELPSATFKTIKNGIVQETELSFNKKPSEVIAELELNKPVFAELCRNGLLTNL